MNRYWVLLFLCVWTGVVKAQTIYEGMMLRAHYIPPTEETIDPDAYSLLVHFYIGANDVALMPDSLQLYLYQSSTGDLIKKFKLGKLKKSLSPVTISHLCNPDSNFTIGQVNYNGYIKLPRASFNDPGGYYFVNDPIGKRPKTSNHSSEGIVLYQWFSPEFLFGQPDGSAPGQTSTFMVAAPLLRCLNTKQSISFYANPYLYFPGQASLVSAPPVLDVKIRLAVPFQAAPNGIKQEVSWKPGYSTANPYPGGPWLPTLSRGANNGEAILSLQPSSTVPAGTYTVAAIVEQWNSGIKVMESLTERTVIYTICPKIDPVTIIYTKFDGTQLSTPPLLCPDQSLTITAITNVPNQQYTWFKDGQPIQNQTTTNLTVTQPGSYSLQITKTGICDTLRIALPIQAAPPFTVSLVSNASINGTTSCTANTPVSISAVASQNVTEYVWYAATNVPLPGINQTAVLNVVQAGIFSVRVKSNEGCYAAASITLTSPSSPTATILPPTATTFCASSSGILRAQRNSDYHYEWFRDGQTTGVTTDSIRTIASGEYRVKVTTSAGCTALSSPVTLNAIPTPTPAIIGDTILCLNQTLTLNVNPATATAYQWFRDGQAESAIFPTYTISLAGKYAVKVTYPNGCTALSPSRTILQVEKMPVQFDSIAPVCLATATPINLRANPPGGTFSGQGVVNNQFIPQIAGAGTFTIIYTPSSTTGCPSGPAQRIVNVRPAPTIGLPHLLETSAGQPVVLPGPAASGYQYQWSPPTFLNNPSIPNPTSTPTTPITYKLTITDSFGCSASDTVHIELIHGFFIPTAFTPNGDGVNDTWTLPGIGDYPQIEVVIYNRWGEVVFFSSGYVQPFDGRYLGEPLPTGIYAYMIRLKPDTKPIRGTVTILR